MDVKLTAESLSGCHHGKKDLLRIIPKLYCPRRVGEHRGADHAVVVDNEHIAGNIALALMHGQFDGAYFPIKFRSIALE